MGEPVRCTDEEGGKGQPRIERRAFESAIARAQRHGQRWHFLDRRQRQPRFANARSVRNGLERARLRQANRLVGDGTGSVGRADLMQIMPEDFLVSRVLTGAIPESDSDYEPS